MKFNKAKPAGSKDWRPGADAVPGVNLTLTVTGFGEKTVKVNNAETKVATVKGTNMANGEAVEVMLTTFGKDAENANRNSIEKLKEGFRIGRQLYKLEAGGVISFRSAVPTAAGGFSGRWPNVLAYNAKETEFIRSGLVMLRTFVNPENNKRSGVVKLMHTDAVFAGKDAESLKDGLKAQSEKFGSRAAFLVRFLNESNQVMGFRELRGTYNKETKSNNTPAEAANVVVGLVAEAQPKSGVARIEVVPMESLSFSSLAINAGEDTGADIASGNFEALRAIEKGYRHETDDAIEIYAKPSVFSVSTSGDFVNKIYPFEPMGAGIDPVLAGSSGLSYAPASQATNHAPASVAPDADDNSGLDDINFDAVDAELSRAAEPSMG